jgi:phospholipase/carboxylesterase
MFRIISISFLLAGPASSIRMSDGIKPIQTIEELQYDEALQQLAEKMDMLRQGKAPEPSKLEIAEEKGEQVHRNLRRVEPQNTSDCAVVFLHGMGVFEPHALYGPLLSKHIDCQLKFPKSPRLAGLKALPPFLRWIAVPSWYHVEKVVNLTPEWHPPHYGSNMDDVHQTIPQIHEAINSLVRSGIPTERIFLGGHSQGSAMSTASAFSYPKKLGGLFMVSGSVDGDTDYNKKATHWANANIPIHWEHSLSDNELTVQFMHVGAKEMEKLGHPVEKVTYNANHNLLPRDVFGRVGEFISKRVARDL